jgi:hypothetical protein
MLQAMLAALELPAAYHALIESWNLEMVRETSSN